MLIILPLPTIQGLLAAYINYSTLAYADLLAETTDIIIGNIFILFVRNYNLNKNTDC